MDPLQSQDAIQQFMKLLGENGRRGQAMDLSALMWYMDGMNRQFEAVLAELQEVREQLAQEKRPSIREHMENAASVLEEKALAVRDKLTGLWEKITQCAADAVRNFKEMGVSALDVLTSRSFPLSRPSHVHPLPNTARAASLKSALNLSAPPNASATRMGTSPPPSARRHRKKNA